MASGRDGSENNKSLFRNVLGGRRSTDNSSKGVATPPPQSSAPSRRSFGLGSGQQNNSDYLVHIPITPDNQPGSGLDPTIGIQTNAQPFVSSTMFTGGFKATTQSHVMDKVTDEVTKVGGPRGTSICQVQGCDDKAMKDALGDPLLPCECNYQICRDCYLDAISDGGKCPGCKEEYKDSDLVDEVPHGTLNGQKALPAPPIATNDDEDDDDDVDDANLGIGKTTDGPTLSMSKALVTHQLQKHPTGDSFDHARWLYETKGTYGYGNAVWPKEDPDLPKDGGGDDTKKHSGGSPPPTFNDTSLKPLSRKVKIAAGIISPYRFLAVTRFVVLILFLVWRINNPNRKAMWLWGMSILCELWFSFSWILDQLPKLCPVNRQTDLQVLKDMFEKKTPENPSGRSDLPGVDIFVSTADPDKEPPLATANTILSILAADFPLEKLFCYLSDDGGSLLTFEAIAEAASFAQVWVPFCRKHDIEPRSPESYFLIRGDPTKGKLRTDFVKDRRRVKREYDEFKVRINGLPESIRRRSDAFTAHEEIQARRAQLETGDETSKAPKIPKATWMADGTHWPGTWLKAMKDHSRGDHAGIIQVMLSPPCPEPIMGSAMDTVIDTTDIDIRLPMLVYMSREKRPGYDHNKKAGAMNALVRTSAIMSNGPFILNLDCDHYFYNSLALREAMCFMLGPGGDRICFVQFPQRFEGVDPSDRYANRNTVFFDINMRALDGVQGPIYVGTGCCFRRTALYGLDPPRPVKNRSCWATCCGGSRKGTKFSARVQGISADINGGPTSSDELLVGSESLESRGLQPKQYGSSTTFVASIVVAEFRGRPLEDQSVRNGRPAGSLTAPREPLNSETVAEAINVISCFYEDKTEWGQRVGWIYGSVTEDVVTGFRMHNRGWKSVYCVTKRDAFRGTAPINLTDRLHQVLRWATGSVEIFFSKNNAIFANHNMKLLQRVAYLNVGVYPFTSIFLVVYCLLPAMSLFSGEFIVATLSVTFLAYLLTITASLILLAILEVKWSGITLEEWWRNEQFWVIGGISAHLAAVFQGLLKVVAGVDISFTLTSKATGEDEDDLFADLYAVKWTALMLPPITIMLVNLIAIGVAVSRTVYSTIPQWSQLVGGVFFSIWVLMHLYPFAKGLMGRKGRTPTIVFVWSGLLAIVISLLWVTISPPAGSSGLGSSSFQFP